MRIENHTSISVLLISVLPEQGEGGQGSAPSTADKRVGLGSASFSTNKGKHPSSLTDGGWEEENQASRTGRQCVSRFL